MPTEAHCVTEPLSALSPPSFQGAEVDGYGAGATLWVTWKGCYDGGGRVQRDWNRHEEREMLQDRLELLASRAAETSPAPRWPFARRVQEYLQSTSPRAFASSVRGMIENLVSACQEDGPPTPFSSFSTEGSFELVAPFLALDAALASDPSATLDPTNFALPIIQREDPWPPPEDATLAPVYDHAVSVLRAADATSAGGGGRRHGVGRASLPKMPEVPIALSAVPCVSMLLHPGRIATTDAECLVRVALISMLVREALPEELTVIVWAGPWTEGASEGIAVSSAQYGADHAHDGAQEVGSDGPIGGTDATPVLEFVVGRHEFSQEGPSGPIEAKRVLLVPGLPLQRTRLTFEIASEIASRYGICPTPPLLIERMASTFKMQAREVAPATY